MNIQALFTPPTKTASKQTTISNNIILAPSDISQKNNINSADLSDPARQAVELAMKQGVQLTEENVAVISTFMDEAPGTVAEKLMALSVALEKQLPLTATILTDIQTARATSLVDCIDSLAPAQPNSSKNLESDANTAHSNRVIEELDHLLSEFLKVFDDTETALPPLGNKTISETQIAQSSVHNTTTAFSSEQPKREINKAQIKQEIGALLAELPTEIAFETLFNTLQQSQIAPAEQSTNQPRLVLKETITEKLAEVKNNFEVFKRESINQLNQIIDRDNQLTPEQRSHYTAKLIDKLDNAIMKSELGLYISMKSERELMKQSAKLSDARDYLIKGKLEQAETIVRTVVEHFEKLAFKPTLKRVFALGNPLNISADELKYDAIAKWAKNGIANFSSSEKSVAGLVQYLRKLGINHDVEVFQDTFGDAPKNETTALKTPRNLKELLLSMAQKSDDQTQPKTTDKLLAHINGQQMQLKMADKAPIQQFMLAVPMQLNGRMTEVKVYIKAKENDLKVDWQNFNMFFVLNTARFDDIGIKVSAVEKKVRIDILNDNIESKAVVMPLAKQLSSYVESIGYTVTGLNFSSLVNQRPNEINVKDKPQPRPLNHLKPTNRSVDFSV